MSSRTRRFAVIGAVAGIAGLSLGAVLLQRCSDQDIAARLVDHAGEVRKAEDTAKGWQPAADGDALHCQEYLQTRAGAWARVDIHGRGRVRLEADTVIRFACTPGEPVFDLQIGEATISATGGDSAWELEFGNARLRQGTEVRVRAGEDAMRFEVVVGSAVVERRGGGSDTLAAGDILEVELGAAEVRRVQPAPAPAPAETDQASIDAGVPDAAPAPAQVTVTIDGRNSRVRMPGEKRWVDLPPGAHQLPPGAELRLGRGSAEISGDNGQVGIDAQGELVIGSPEGVLAALRKGAGWMRARTGVLAMSVPGGELRARPGASGGRTSVDVERDRTRIRALVGAVDIAGKTGASASLSTGERADLSHRGRISIQDQAPARADLVIQAGESPVVHDPRPPTAVGIRFGGACPGEGIVELSESASFRDEIISKGSGQANVRVDAGGRRGGTQHYRVRCIEQGGLAEAAAASGTIRVVRDAATRQLPRAAPVNTVDADGRRYTVLYQNRLPQIAFQWPGTSDAGPYKLHLAPGKGQPRVFDASEPAYRMRAGELDEDTYEYYFQGASARSRTSVLRIEFDNAAPSAYLRLPAVSQAWSGDTLEVAGTALPDSEVSVDGVAVPLDRQGRFSTQVALPIATGSVAVRLTSPRQGVHYYLRRDASR
jgi:hypothetical protein